MLCRLDRAHERGHISECEAPFDFIFEATGSAECAFDALHALAVNGVLCLTSITGGSFMKSVPVDRLNYDLVGQMFDRREAGIKTVLRLANA